MYPSAFIPKTQREEDVIKSINLVLSRARKPMPLVELCQRSSGIELAELKEVIVRNPNNFECFEDGQLFVKQITKVEICETHCSKNKTCSGTIPFCTGLHICKFYLLSGKCPFGGQCTFGHDLTISHNMQILKENLLDGVAVEDLEFLFGRAESRTSVTAEPPKICKFYNTEGGCRYAESGKLCQNLHICKYYILGRCRFGKTCCRSHDILESGVKEILEQHGISTLRTPKEIIADLREAVSNAGSEGSSVGTSLLHRGMSGLSIGPGNYDGISSSDDRDGYGISQARGRKADDKSDAEEKRFADNIAVKTKIAVDVGSGLPLPDPDILPRTFVAEYSADDDSNAGKKRFGDSIVMKAKLEAENDSDAEERRLADTSVMKAKLKADNDRDAEEKRFADKIVMKARLEGRLPSASELAVLCQTYGRKSDELKHVCDTICDHVKDECKHIVDVWPSYRPCEENNIIFCVITDIPCERISCPYSVVQRAIGEYSVEEREILKQELNRGLEFTDDAVEHCIDNNADKFMNNHKNLSVMSASLLKSEKFATSLEKVSQQVCIVLLVPVKGLIPLSEEAFPKYIDDFPVDVREGNFRYKFGGKPNDKHESVKMGCAIHGDESGTLGGFLDHNEHGICCLTVAHVMLNVTKMKRTFPGQYTPESSELCYQPKPPNAFGYLIKAIAIEGNENKPGMDVALVKIDERIPLDGRFPDAEKDKWSDAGYTPGLEMQYNTGKVVERSEIPRGQVVLKYGQATTITQGVLRLNGMAVRDVNLHDNSEGYKYSLKKQMQVLHIKDAPFSKEGDSGSLVLMRGKDGHLVAVGMLVGGTDSYDAVTPICDILRAFDTALSLKPFP